MTNKKEGTAGCSLKSEVIYKVFINDYWSLLQNWQGLSKNCLIPQVQTAELLYFLSFLKLSFSEMITPLQTNFHT